MSAPSFAVLRATAASRAGALGLAGLVVGLVALPLWADPGILRLFVEVAYLLALAQIWNLLAGYAGLVSIGQQTFVGLGGYALFVLSGVIGVHPLAAIPVAGVLAALVAVPVAWLVFRLSGAYFAIGTWVVAEVFMLGFAQISSLGGGSGMSLPAAIARTLAGSAELRAGMLYWLALALAAGCTALVYLWLRSRHGLALTAIRDSEAAAESLGVDNRWTKLLVYVVAAFATGMIGALIFLSKLRISPEAAFNVTDWTAYVIFIVVIGGIGRIEGPFVGIAVFFLLRELLAHLGTWYLLVLGAAAIGIMLTAPQGLWGLIATRTGLEFFPVRRRLQYFRRTPDS